MKLTSRSRGFDSHREQPVFYQSCLVFGLFSFLFFFKQDGIIFNLLLILKLHIKYVLQTYIVYTPTASYSRQNMAIQKGNQQG